MPDHANNSMSPPEKVDLFVPLIAHVTICAIAILGFIYALVMIGFNVIYHKHKMIKMTSPNINMIIMFGCILGFTALALLGFDQPLLSAAKLSVIQQATAYLLVIGFTCVFGALFLKSWRVYMIFKNLNVNGKMTRDEHLLIGVGIMLALDLVILLPWTFVDAIVCKTKTFLYQVTVDSPQFSSLTATECVSRFQLLWVLLIYLYKLTVIGIGAYFTWNIRHVKLATLKDAREMTVVLAGTICGGLLALPLLLIPQQISPTLKYVIGSLIIWFVLLMTMTLLFTPKIYLAWKSNKAKESDSSQRLLFSESMKRTQAAATGCCSCLRMSREDHYAQEVVATEMEELKRIIKQKDGTIRELNDRLYYGAERFQEYLTAPRARNALTHTGAQPPPTAQRRQTNSPPYQGVVDDKRPSVIDQSPHKRAAALQHATRGATPSPNHDSAIDNTSPASSSSGEHFSGGFSSHVRDATMAPSAAAISPSRREHYYKPGKHKAPEVYTIGGTRDHQQHQYSVSHATRPGSRRPVDAVAMASRASPSRASPGGAPSGYESGEQYVSWYYDEKAVVSEI